MKRTQHEEIVEKNYKERIGNDKPTGKSKVKTKKSNRPSPNMLLKVAKRKFWP